jgi:hypothetical protein
MNLTRILPRLTVLCATLLLVSEAQTAAQSTPGTKLDKHLAPIAEAAEQHVETPLMERALVRQSTHSNSPLEARWNASGQVQVYLHYVPGTASPSVTELENLGATDIVQSPELAVIQAWLPASALKAAADLPGISRVSLPRYAIYKRAPVTGPIAETGSVTSEGDQILGSAAFRSATGITGQGISVGVISDGDDHISESQKTGDLPANIVNDPNDAGSFKSSGDEGTAMMEIVYDIAPGVKQLGFCGPQTTVDFITCLNDFATKINANVIVDDLAFPGQDGMFSTDAFTNALNNFAAGRPNLRLVTATGNDGTDYWQGSWQPMTVSIPAVNGVPYTQAQTFNNSTAGPVPYLQITPTNPGDTLAYVVEWNDPWDDSGPNDLNDYDVVVFDSPTGGNAVACNQSDTASTNNVCNQSGASTSPITPGPTPVQGTSWTASKSNYYLEVFFRNGTPGQNLKILVFDQSAFQVTVDPVTAGSVYGHAALAYPTEISVGAITADLALSGSYNIELYSSLGPVEFGVTNGKTQVIGSPQSIPKPDFAAPDCVSITGAGGFPSPFCGTSAAAPHIAGLVALLMAGYPGKSPYTLLQQAATQPGSPDPNGTFGFGVPIMTNLLSAGLYPVPVASISAPADGTSVGTGQMVAFKGSCTADKAVTGVKTDWNFGAGSNLADSNQANPSVAFTSAGTYAVSLKCTDSTGSNTATVNLTVTAPSKGGSLDLLSLLTLGLLAAYRRKSISC